MSTVQVKNITCHICGKETPKRGPGTQKYCVECSAIKDLERKRNWARENTLTQEQVDHRTVRRANDRERIKIAGAERSENNKVNIAWLPTNEIDLSWVVRIAVPFRYSLSKNHMFTNTRFGHMALRKESRSSRDEITQLLREAIRKVEIKNNKIWIDIFVQKPNHKGDAINVVDLVCDAIKDATGVDDRWYSIRRIDWQIVKDKPMMYIGIGQEQCEDSIACCSCGMILPLDHFHKNSHAKHGVTPTCRVCKQAIRKGSRR
jgi:hypothetical protein